MYAIHFVAKYFYVAGGFNIFIFLYGPFLFLVFFHLLLAAVKFDGSALAMQFAGDFCFGVTHASFREL